MQGTQHRRPTRANACPSSQLRTELGDRQVGLTRDQRDQAPRNLAADRGDVAAALGPRGNVSGFSVPAQHTADGRATNPEERRDLFVAEPALVERPDDRFAQLGRSGHPNRRSQFADHINRIAG